MGGQGRKPIITHVSPKRYRKRCGLPKPLPLGEVALRSNDGEGKPGRKEPLRSDRQAFCQSDTIAVSELFGSSLALSVGLAPASSPRGGAIGMSVRLPFVQPLSLASLDSSPSRGASGEEEKFSAMPKPPLGRGGGTASAVTERLSSAAAYGQALLRTTSQSRFARQLP